MNLARFPLIATDGFEFYEKVVRRVFGPACLYGQVIKTRRNDRVVRVERRTRIGAAWRWEQASRDSEDSTQLNTSFIERLNLTIRQGSAYLCRRTICYARCKERLAAHLELLRCYYNFVRPHRALRFGAEVRTPAVQAGLTPAADHVKGDLLVDNDFLGMDEGEVRVRALHDLGHCRRDTIACGGVATLDDGSTDTAIPSVNCRCRPLTS